MSFPLADDDAKIDPLFHRFSIRMTVFLSSQRRRQTDRQTVEPNEATLRLKSNEARITDSSSPLPPLRTHPHTEAHIDLTRIFGGRLRTGRGMDRVLYSRTGLTRARSNSFDRNR